jgi:hypothetical protein
MGPNTARSPVYNDTKIKITMIKSAYYVIDYKERNSNKHVEKCYSAGLANVFVIVAII